MKFADLPDRSAHPATHECTIALLVDGWPDDAVTCVRAVLEHAPDDVRVVALDLGDVDGAGGAVRDLVADSGGRLEVVHVEETLETVGWGRARTALLKADTARVHGVADLSTVFDGDAVTPLLAAFEDETVVASGWRGVNVDTTDWYSFVDAGPGEVDAVLSYFFLLRRSAGLATPAHSSARFYRNADLEWGLALRASGGVVVAPVAELPAHQERHRGYHDSDPEVRDAESKRNYMRMLKRFKGRHEILAPR
jgi:hypothetical protein